MFWRKHSENQSSPMLSPFFEELWPTLILIQQAPTINKWNVYKIEKDKHTHTQTLSIQTHTHTHIFVKTGTQTSTILTLVLSLPCTILTSCGF